MEAAVTTEPARDREERERQPEGSRQGKSGKRRGYHGSHATTRPSPRPTRQQRKGACDCAQPDRADEKAEGPRVAANVPWRPKMHQRRHGAVKNPMAMRSSKRRDARKAEGISESRRQLAPPLDLVSGLLGSRGRRHRSHDGR